MMMDNMIVSEIKGTPFSECGSVEEFAGTVMYHNEDFFVNHDEVPKMAIMLDDENYYAVYLDSSSDESTLVSYLNVYKIAEEIGARYLCFTGSFEKHNCETEKTLEGIYVISFSHKDEKKYLYTSVRRNDYGEIDGLYRDDNMIDEKEVNGYELFEVCSFD
jgi:uncharacterized protein (DUF1330 family)